MKFVRLLYILSVLLILIFSWSVILTEAKPNECEKYAKDYIKKYGGSLIFVQPLKLNGAYDLGHFNGHFLVKLPTKEIKYYDPETDIYLNTPDAWFSDRKSEWWDLSRTRPPFAMYFHY